jgi:formyl-CoA transferase
VRRQRDGVGGFIDVSMLDSAIVTMGWIVSNQLIAGRSPIPMGNDNFTASPSGTFRTKQGLLNIAANKQEQFETLCRLLGAPELVSDPRFAEREARKLNRATLTEALEAHLAAHDAQRWETLLNEAGVPAGQVLDVSEALTQPQVSHRELTMTLPINDPEQDSITVTRSGFQIDGAPQSVEHGPPTLGQHSDEILLEAGFTTEEIALWHRNGTI